MTGKKIHYRVSKGRSISGVQLYGIETDGEVLIENVFDDSFEAHAFVNYINYANLKKNEIFGTLAEYIDSPHRILRIGKEK